MMISACIITKNEEKNIVRCLNSIKDIVDEIIVVDTGSNDKTINIAGKYTKKIYHYKWSDDFAKARNFAIDKANGDYILFLDADEYFVQGCKLKEIISSDNNLYDAYLIKIININIDENDRIMDEFLAIRLFKNDINIRYQGAIHEQIVKTNNTNLSIDYINDVNLYHTGYSSSLIQQKAERNLQRLQQELALSEDKERLYAYLAETYYYLGDKDSAEKYAKLDIALGKKNVTYASKAYRILIEILKEDYDKNDELKNVLEQAIAEFPQLPDFKAEYALYYASTFNYDKAVEIMKSAVVIAENYNDIEPTMFKNEKVEIANNLIKTWEETKNTAVKISACVIVKNEEENIEQWLANTAIYADEQIVVDTGSNDKTIEIIEKSSAQLYHFKWNNNFAEAKNYAISKAKGDWIVFLDADECFSKETVNNVREIIIREHKNIETVDAILCTIINIDQDQGGKEIHRFINLRLFRNVDYLKFHGKIHEAIGNSKRELHILIEKEQLQIIHTGYSKSIVDKKVRRNLELLLEDIEKNGEGVQHYRYLSDCYHALGNHEQAIKYAKLHINSNATSVGNESDIYRNLINSMVIVKVDTKEVEVYLKKALALFPNMPDFYAYYAANLFRENRQLEAKPYLEKALQLNEVKTDFNEATVFANLLSETYSYLAEVNLKEGNISEARINIHNSLKDNKYNITAFFQLLEVNSNNSLETIIKEIGKYYNIKEECDFVIENLYNNISNNLLTFLLLIEYATLYKEKYKILSSKYEMIKLINEKLYQEASNLITENIVKDLKQLIVIILRIDNEEKLQEYERYLPGQIKNVLESFLKENVSLTDSQIDDYMIVLMAILELKQELLPKAIEIASNFSNIIKFKIAISLCEYKLWTEAATIFQELFNQTQEQSGEIFYWSAICNFYLSNKNLAKEHFLKAKKLGVTRNEIESYLYWLEKEYANG